MRVAKVLDERDNEDDASENWTRIYDFLGMATAKAIVKKITLLDITCKCLALVVRSNSMDICQHTEKASPNWTTEQEKLLRPCVFSVVVVAVVHLFFEVRCVRMVLRCLSFYSFHWNSCSALGHVSFFCCYFFFYFWRFLNQKMLRLTIRP